MRSFFPFVGTLVICLTVGIQPAYVDAKPFSTGHYDLSARNQHRYHFIDPVDSSSSPPSFEFQETNAERLKRGLTPRKPKRLHVPGIAPTPPDDEPTPTPTPTDGSLPEPTSEQPTPTPTTPVSPPQPTYVTGHIHARGTNIDFSVGTSLNQGGYRMTTTDPVLEVGYLDDLRLGLPTNLKIFTANQPRPNLAFIESGVGIISTRSISAPDYGVLGGSEETPLGSSTFDNTVLDWGESYAAAESKVFVIDPDTYEITVHWLDDTDSIVTPTIFYFSELQTFGITSKPELLPIYGGLYGGTVTPVTLYFVPDVVTQDVTSTV
ncbi:hypothetical protein C8Q75DRAFT_802830 [Abortiporus biennis]|nr:hypothetical protein C8Q75DRAFT_802830 [Abortiporus biennis]